MRFRSLLLLVVSFFLLYSVIVGLLKYQAVDSRSGLKVAYLILVHSDESVLASQRLLPAIWRPDFFYLYVVDQSTDELGRLRLDEFLGSPAAVFHGSANVRAMTTNVLSGWGTLGLVQNELDGLQELLGLGKWDYAINLSGDTYPLVGQAELAERLAHWRGANFVTDPGTRPQRANEVPELKLARLANVTWPTGVAEPDQYGSQWFILTREFVEYTLSSARARNVLLAMGSGKADVADESFFQIVLMNSPFNSTVGYQRDLQVMVESDCVFARKLHPEVSQDFAVGHQH
ncbi:xylosyltransferase I, putative [Acanthamoeba castellanii str. Neff]|uniref:protein xylosyltransferase n=1 Tax=Acanthamoeba castellanii (strain ATCC 30010 / Neff) TaxID=1257118 RepID=L8HIE6_ACACF|nr:xylosyltransferase I, putative [Acanthamoeba castellanii str. Neff]ELR24151.1 xylosyltransferase I, putative [Acanthamoeba castellanii str. Neff]